MFFLALVLLFFAFAVLFLVNWFGLNKGLLGSAAAASVLLKSSNSRS